MFFFSSFYGWSQVTNSPPNIVATGDQSYCPLSQINIVSSFDIIDQDDTEIEALHIQISTGYINGQDQLILMGNHPNIIETWSAAEGKLSFRGVGGVNVSYVDLIAAVHDVVFESSSPNVSGDKYFSFTVGDANYLPSTGHYYEYVSSVGITWSQARDAAAARTYFGLQGYLATITSAEEAQLSGEQAAGAGWIGGSDAANEGVWEWVTGPEAGTVFWNGGINGSSPNYANWNNQEPNNAGDEDYAHVTAPNVGTPGSWNDLRNAGDPNSLSPYHPQGYIVEYGGTPDDPIVDISASTKISVPLITNTVEFELCGEGPAVLEASANNGTVVWFDALTGGNQVHTGLTYNTPLLTATTSYYVAASVNGCLDTQRTEVIATVKPIPTIDFYTDELVCNPDSATLSATSSAGIISWYDIPAGGTAIATGTTFTTPILTTTTTYYVDATSNGCTTAIRTPVTFTVQHTPAPVANASQAFCDIDNATVSSLVITGTDILWYATDTDTTPLSSTDILASGTYYATQTVNTCESLARLAVNVTIYETIEPLALTAIPVFEICDNNTDTDGDDTNGIVEINLRSQEFILLNGKSDSDFSFDYFLDDAYTDEILSPKTFENTQAGGQTIYVRMFNNLDTACYTDTAFSIQVNPLPNALPSIVFRNCDEDGNPDGFTDFNLSEVIEVITSEDLNSLNVTFHSSESGAEQGIDVVSSPFNNQTENIVYARVEFTNTGCYRISTINLEVSTTSFRSGYLYELQSCDNDAIIDGIATFDLASASANFINEFPTGQNLSVHYYPTLIDAQLELNEITNTNTNTNTISYSNKIKFSELLFVRVESNDNGECFGIGPHLLLTVHPRPEFEVNQDPIYCLNGSPITLRTYNPKGNYTYEWMDESGVVISNEPNAEVSDGGQYTVIANSIFNCESFPVTFNVVESGISNISIDDITIEDLSDNNTITINTTDIGIGDYEFALDDALGPFQDVPFFNQVHSGDHVLYVRDKKGCGTIGLPIFVLGFPKFFTPNGDNYNDIWNIKGLGDNYTASSVIRIYDRYGKLIKQLRPGISGWNGTFNGEPLAESDYWFVANLVGVSGNSKIYKGHFSLIR